MKWGFSMYLSFPKRTQINARAETVKETPMFAKLLHHNRCLIICEGYFEWEKTPKGYKQPYYFHLQQTQIITFAGLFFTKKSLRGEEEHYVIMTVPPSKEVAWIHNRMPAILQPHQIDLWLNPNIPIDEALAILQPYSNSQVPLLWHPVSININNQKYNACDCIQDIRLQPKTKTNSLNLESCTVSDELLQSIDYLEFMARNRHSTLDSSNQEFIEATDDNKFWNDVAELIEAQLEDQKEKELSSLLETLPLKKQKLDC